MRIGFLFCTVLLAAACTSGSPSGGAIRGSRTESEGTQTLGNHRRALEHPCIGDGAGGLPGNDQGPPENGWRQTGLVIGEVGFPEHDIFRGRPAEQFKGAGGQYAGHSFSIVLGAGERTTITVIRGEGSFLLDPGASGGDGGYALSDGLKTLRLQACDDQDTRFGEALIVAGPQCVGLRVTDGDGTEGVVEMPFGADCD